MGTLEKQLHDDMVAALKAHDKELVTTLRMAIGALKNEKVAGKTARELSDADEVTVLQREVSKRKDSAQAYTDGNRPELAAKELAEAAVIARYLPAALTGEELDAIIGEEVAAAAAALGQPPAMKQMGLVMKAVQARTAGRADGATVAAKVRAALA